MDIIITCAATISTAAYLLCLAKAVDHYIKKANARAVTEMFAEYVAARKEAK